MTVMGAFRSRELRILTMLASSYNAFRSSNTKLSVPRRRKGSPQTRKAGLTSSPGRFSNLDSSSFLSHRLEISFKRKSQSF
ncbi:hypothetical protein SADUNF_Sadunf10G0036600 [Salix dunnii]|uniref:Uncharacterized protein n=1 Tax=Salix dunnii TaxID=1413687 RepID=A0A835JNK0_9ROSI|nr:hypothetical protein SADUNF_Sadunf10G0036600 [Salix dunnii]